MIMRKNYQMWLLGALFGGLVLPFAGCSNEDDPISNGPGSGETVKTQFAINIPYAKKAETKMSDVNTQQDGASFLGMKNIRLVPYVATNWSTSQTIDRILALGDIVAGNVSGNETQKIYSDVDIPVDTDHFLFYGEANPNTPTNVANGTLTAILDGQTSRADIKFKLVDIFSGTSFGDAETALLTLLNNVEDATDGSTTTWASYSTASETSGDKFVLKQLYNSFIEMEAGSANSILKLMQSLYTEVSKIGTGTTEGNVAASIKTAITTAVTSNNVSLALTESGGTLSMTFTDDGADISNFPANLNLPDGAARVTFGSGAFSSNNFSLEVGDGTNGKLKIENLTYPSSLYYFVESDLKASADASAAFPSNGSWDGYTWDGTTWNQTSVQTSTKTIAMTKPVQYGVGLLVATVKVGSDGLIDNGGNTVNIGSGFELTGVLIGGQPNELGWNMYSSSATWSKVIYDAAVPSNTVTETASSPNYTLALDNSKFDADGTTRSATQDVVNIVIELKNGTGKNIVGQDGTIFPNAKFYLVAQLDPKSKSVADVTNPSVFMQDYKTTANLTITSLKNAYNTIPDLGSSSLRFGLAVDLDWKTGLSFDVEIP